MPTPLRPSAEPDSPAAQASRREAELENEIRQLRARQQHLESLLGSARDAVLEMDSDGLITRWNAGAELMLGWRTAEAVGQRMCELIVPHAQRAAHEAGLAAYLKTGQARTIQRLLEVEALHKSGALLPVELSIFTVPAGGKIGFGAFIRDISDRRALADTVRRSTERYRAVIEHVDEGMIVVKDERIAYANERAAQIAGISLDEMREVGFLHRIHPDDHDLVLGRQRRRLAGEDVPSRYELRLLLPGGEIRWIGISVTVVPWDGEQAILTFFSDISQRRKLEEKLRDTLDDCIGCGCLSIDRCSLANPADWIGRKGPGPRHWMG